MSRGAESAVFSLERYRTQWGHLPFVFLPFLGVTAAAIGLFAIEPVLGEGIATALLSAVGVGYAAFVLTLPWSWRRWRARGRLELRLGGGAIRFVDPRSNAVVGRCAAEPGRVVAAEFQYTVNARGGGGTYRAPAMIIGCDERAPIAVGVQGSRLTWRVSEARVARPDYLMATAEWETFVDILGIADRLVVVVDARVG